ncbi:fimbrial protein [Pseudomonas protegens]|uniref:fimbrial protein n=1 Tax=Pseudomonas TaxID=286 RepID=UPI0032082A0D
MGRLRGTVVFPIALLCACSLWQGAAWAAICSGVTQSTHYTALERSIPRDAPIGTIIFKDEINKGATTISCGDIGPFWMHMELIGSGAELDNHVFESGIPGVGVRVFWHSPPEIHQPGGTYIGRKKTVQLSNGLWFNAKFEVPHRFTFELVKTGPIASGTTKNLRMEIWYADFKTNLVDLSQFTLTQKNSGCRPIRPFDSVPMPTANLKDFTHIGSSTGAKAFLIELDCDKGVKIAYRIDGMHRQSDILLNDTGKEMATGVGIQLFKGDTGSSVLQPLWVRTDFTTVPTSQDKERLAIPLTARYVQTESSVTGGHVRTTATVTLIYE